MSWVYVGFSIEEIVILVGESKEACIKVYHTLSYKSEPLSVGTITVAAFFISSLIDEFDPKSRVPESFR